VEEAISHRQAFTACPQDIETCQGIKPWLRALLKAGVLWLAGFTRFHFPW